MADWKLHTNSTTYPLSALSLNEPVLSLKNAETDSLRIRFSDTNLDSDSLFTHGDAISLSKNGTTWFRGTVTQTPRRGQAEQESLDMIISGPWHQLENLVYQQQWQIADDPNSENSSTTPTYIGHVVLTQALDGAKTTMTGQLLDIVQYAIDSGVNIALGTIDIPLTIPWEEYADLSCADAIREMLKWTPDAVAWFDYTTGTPTLNIRRAADLNATTLQLDNDSTPQGQATPIESLTIEPRHDLQVSEVFLRYVQDNRINDYSWREINTDAYPLGATGRQVGALTKTLELRGARFRNKVTRLKQEVKAEALGDIATLSFWQKHFPQLSDVDAADITISDTLRTGSDLSLTNVLLEGSVTDWMETQHELKAEVQRVQCRIGPFHRVIEGKVTDETVFYNLDTELTLTNATSKTYRFTKESPTTGTSAEEVPTGLAQALYETLHPLQWQGEIQLVEHEVSGLVRPGQVINLNGGRSEWQSMRAIVNRVEESLAQGRTRITLSPSPSLSAQGLLALFRLNQNPYRRHGEGSRASAKVGGGSTEEDEQGLGKFHPAAKGTMPGTPQYSRFVIQEPDEATAAYYRSVIIDAADLTDTSTVPEDIICQLREIPVAAVDGSGNAVLRYATALISEPYTKP